MFEYGILTLHLGLRNTQKNLKPCHSQALEKYSINNHTSVPIMSSTPRHRTNSQVPATFCTVRSFLSILQSSS